MSDNSLREAIEHSLASEGLAGGGVVVAVKDGRATLKGSVPSFAARCGALHAASRIAGVQNVAVELHVVPVPVADNELTRRARSLIEWNALIPRGAVEAEAAGGSLTLQGTLDGRARHQALIAQLTPLAGITELVDRIRVTESGGATPLSARIRAALRAQAGTDADRIRFDIGEDGTVRIEGELSDWQCHGAVIQAVRALDGVERVDDAITIDD